MRVLVTGCAGFIGSHLTEALLEEGNPVLGVDSLSDNYDIAVKLRNLERARESAAFSFRRLDLTTADLAPVIADCDAVVHLAAEPGVRPSWGSRFELYLANNVLATQRLLETSKQDPARRIIFASSSSVYGYSERFPTPETALPKPLSPYGVTKLSCEHLCQLYRESYGLATTVLRYFSVYGPRQRPDMAFHRFCRAVIEREPVTIFGDGRQTRDFTFVGDVVAATKASLQSPLASGATYNIGGGSQVPLLHALELIAKLAERPIDVRHDPSERGEVRHTGADISRAREELGYQPETSIEEGLAAELDWMLKIRGS